MPSEDEMTVDERRKYLCKMKKRYTQAHQRERGRLSDEMEAVTGLHRKSLIRLMKGNLERNPRRKQPGRTYARDVDDAFPYGIPWEGIMSETFDYLCAERLTPNLAWMATHRAHHGELETSHLREDSSVRQCGMAHEFARNLAILAGWAILLPRGLWLHRPLPTQACV